MKEITMADCTKGELYDRCKELEDINGDLYEALREIRPYLHYLDQNNLMRITSLIRKALAKVEGK